MDDEEAVEIELRLVAMNKSLADSLSWIETIAATANASGDAGLAFASFMLRDAIAAWRVAMNDYIKKHIRRLGEQ